VPDTADVRAVATPSPQERLRLGIEEIIQPVRATSIVSLLDKARAVDVDPEPLVALVQSNHDLARDLAAAAPRLGSEALLNEAHSLLAEFAQQYAELLKSLPFARLGPPNDQGHSHARGRLGQMATTSWLEGQPPNVPWQHRVRALLSYVRSIDADTMQAKALYDEVSAAHRLATDKSQAIEVMFDKVRDAEKRWTELRFAKEFEDAAKGHAVKAWLFIALSAALGVGLVVLLTHLWPLVVTKETTPFMFVAAGLPRVLAVSFGSTIIFLTVASFRANSHLAVVNQHRANVLRTYDVLLSSATAESRAAMLKAAADTIFQAGSSGFLGDNGSRLDEQLVGLLRDGFSKAKKGDDA
jgi:hypothetical protein